MIYKDIARRDHISYEYDYVHKDGHRVPTLVIMRAIDKDNLDQGFIFSMIDNTERRRAQDLIQKLNESLEQKVRERTRELEEKLKELERFREATVDRELRMKELKGEILKELKMSTTPKPNVSGYINKRKESRPKTWKDCNKKIRSLGLK